MRVELRSLAWGLALSSAALLVACGGGSDGGDTVDGGDNNGGGSVTLAAVDRFVGNFASPCLINDEVLQVASGQPVRLVRTMAVTKVSDTQARFLQRDTYYASTDVECKGNSLGNSVWNHTGNALKFGTSAQVTLGNQTVTAYRIDGNIEAIGGLSSGTTVVINGLQFPGDFFSEAYAYKDLLALSTDGNQLYAGNTDTEDSNGYPTALDTEFFLTRLP